MDGMVLTTLACLSKAIEDKWAYCNLPCDVVSFSGDRL